MAKQMTEEAITALKARIKTEQNTLKDMQKEQGGHLKAVEQLGKKIGKQADLVAKLEGKIAL